MRSPRDALTLAVTLPILTLIWRYWAEGLPRAMVMAQALGIGALSAFLALVALTTRCAYHREEGALAAFAQTLAECLRYAVPMWLFVVAAGLCFAAIGNPGNEAFWLAGVITGTLAGLAWVAFLEPLVRRIAARIDSIMTGFGPGLRSWPMLAVAAMAIGAAVAIASVVAELSLPVTAVGVLVPGIVASMILGRVDAETVRFRALIGVASWPMIRGQSGRILAAMIALALPLLPVPNRLAGLVPVLLGFAVILFTACRILAYQVFERRIADWVVTAIFGGSGLASLAFPPLGPLVIVGAFAALARRAQLRRWLIA